MTASASTNNVPMSRLNLDFGNDDPCSIQRLALEPDPGSQRQMGILQQILSQQLT